MRLLTVVALTLAVLVAFAVFVGVMLATPTVRTGATVPSADGTSASGQPAGGAGSGGAAGARGGPEASGGSDEHSGFWGWVRGVFRSVVGAPDVVAGAPDGAGGPGVAQGSPQDGLPEFANIGNHFSLAGLKLYLLNERGDLYKEGVTPPALAGCAGEPDPERCRAAVEAFFAGMTANDPDFTDCTVTLEVGQAHDATSVSGSPCYRYARDPKTPRPESLKCGRVDDMPTCPTLGTTKSELDADRVGGDQAGEQAGDRVGGAGNATTGADPSAPTTTPTTSTAPTTPSETTTTSSPPTSG